jgi:hypothetical protein
MADETPQMIIDGGGVVAQWSHQAEELWGRPAGEVVGRAGNRPGQPCPRTRRW